MIITTLIYDILCILTIFRQIKETFNEDPQVSVGTPCFTHFKDICINCETDTNRLQADYLLLLAHGSSNGNTYVRAYMVLLI
jgi:hypothetical protein